MGTCRMRMHRTGPTNVDVAGVASSSTCTSLAAFRITRRRSLEITLGTALAVVDHWVTHDPELDIYASGFVPHGTACGTILSGLICTITRWPHLGIRVIHRYDPESSPPRLIQRLVDYE